MTSYLKSESQRRLRDTIDILFREYSQLDNMGVSQHLQVLDLTFNPRVHVWCSDFGSVDKL